MYLARDVFVAPRDVTCGSRTQVFPLNTIGSILISKNVSVVVGSSLPFPVPFPVPAILSFVVLSSSRRCKWYLKILLVK